MWFLIKSAICLAIVFSWMDWPKGESPREMAQAAQSHLTEKATRRCSADPRQCLALAQKAQAGLNSAGLRGSLDYIERR
ncbi:MAG: hypothetical protein KGL46_08060 [Hyphomicrobiales bacterium]|nr:hypothetical protein [Hyphomicrobiales bacterium]